MANNYLQFSEVIPKLTVKEAAWLEKAHQERRANDVGDFQMEITKTPPFPKEYGRHAWLYSEESGSVENVASMVQEFLQKFRPNDFFPISWAHSCSKPRVGEFGGGAVFVTANYQKWMSDSQFLMEQQASWYKRRGKKNGPVPRKRR